MKRRTFLGISAAAGIVAVIPTAIGRAVKPPIGTTFHTSHWSDDTEDGDALTRDAQKIFRNTERVRGVRLGHYAWRYNWCSERAALVLQAEASVIGYA